MATFEETAIAMMFDRGMFREDAEAVLERIKSDPANAAVVTRWHDDMGGYPPQSVTTLWITVSRNAAEWIAENCPKAWYRPLFEDNGKEVGNAK